MRPFGVKALALSQVSSAAGGASDEQAYHSLWSPSSGVSAHLYARISISVNTVIVRAAQLVRSCSFKQCSCEAPIAASAGPNSASVFA